MNSADPERNREMLDAVECVTADYRSRGLDGVCREELEAMTAYHELLTSTVRVNRIHPDSPVQDALREDFLQRFPAWRENRYIAAWPKKHRLLLALIVRRRYRLLHSLMKTKKQFSRPNEK